MGAKHYSSYQAQRVCARRVARSLEQSVALATEQNGSRPTRGVRQFIVNTPEKTKVLHLLFRDHDEANFAVQLPADYNTLQRCNDSKEDYWPQLCSSRASSNASCYETSELGFSNICLRPVDCHQRSLRLACEFTLPGSIGTPRDRSDASRCVGSPELIASRFRQCPKTRGLRGRLTFWAWLLIAVGAMLLLLFILGGVLAYIRNSKKGSSEIKQSPTKQRLTADEGNRRMVNVTDARAAIFSSACSLNARGAGRHDVRSSSASRMGGYLLFRCSFELSHLMAPIKHPKH